MTKDIITSLRLSDERKEFKSSCFRKNLYYDLFFQNVLENPYEHLRDFINECLNLENEADVPKVCEIQINIHIKELVTNLYVLYVNQMFYKYFSFIFKIFACYQQMSIQG